MDYDYLFFMDAKKCVGIWLRVSTEMQAGSDSPEHHRMRAKMYAKAKGWDIVETYHLEGVSGKSVLGHSEAKRMLHDVERGHIDTLIFSKIARLARNMKELLEISTIFQKSNADLVSLHESIDTSTPAGRLFFNIQGALSEWEREEISERVKASVKVRADMGKTLGGQAPYGYKWVDQKLEIEETEAPIRKLMFELFLEHKRIKTATNELNKMGHRSRTGKRFSSTSVRRLLTDSTAKGIRRVNYTQTTDRKGAWVEKPEDQWVYIEVPAIISAEDFDKVNAIIKANQSGRRKATNNREHLFTGLIHCSCGSKMYHISTTKKYVCQKCKRKIPRDDMDSIFKEQLRGLVLNEDELRDKLNDTRSQVDSIDSQVETLRAEMPKIEAKLEELLDLHSKGEIPTNGFGKHYQPHFDRLQEIESTLPELEGKRDALLVDAQSTDQIIEDAKDLYSRFDNLDHKERREIVTAITNSITIDDDEISIDLKYIMPPQEMETFGERNYKG